MRRFSFILVLLLALLVTAGCGQYGKRYVADDGTGAKSGDEKTRFSDENFEDTKVRTADGCTKLTDFTGKSTGQIDISYKGISDEQVDELLATVKLNPTDIVVQPRKSNPKDGVFYTVSGKQIHCKQPSKAALQYLFDNVREDDVDLGGDSAPKS